jgi:hypothetical protein
MRRRGAETSGKRDMFIALPNTTCVNNLKSA